MHSQAEVCISNQSNAYIYTHTRLHIRAQRTAETPPASPAPSVSLSVLHSRAQTGPQQSQCEISCLCGALSACACLFGCTSTLGLDAYFRTYLQSVCQEVTHVGFQKCACVCVCTSEKWWHWENPPYHLRADFLDLRAITLTSASYTPPTQACKWGGCLFTCYCLLRQFLQAYLGLVCHNWLPECSLISTQRSDLSWPLTWSCNLGLLRALSSSSLPTNTW